MSKFRAWRLTALPLQQLGVARDRCFRLLLGRRRPNAQETVQLMLGGEIRLQP
jgi:hypothetical protein